LAVLPGISIIGKRRTQTVVRESVAHFVSLLRNQPGLTQVPLGGLDQADVSLALAFEKLVARWSF